MLSTYYMSATMLDAKDTVNETTMISVPMKFMIS